MNDTDLSAPHDGQRIVIKPPRRRPRNQTELMSEHVVYEIEAFGALDELLRLHGRSDLRDFDPGSEEWWLGNTLLEAFLLRTRTLDEFLYGDVIRFEGNSRQPLDLGDGATALDFVTDPQAWLDERPPRPPELRRRRINRTIAHLSWDRVQAGWETDALSSFHLTHQKAQEWPVPEIWHALRPTLAAFLEHLDHAAVCGDFAGRAEMALTGSAINPD